MSNQTVSASALRSAIEATTDDRALELEDHDGYVCDAVAEIADYDVSIYTADQIAYCREHADSVREALFEGLALDGRDYFKANPGDDFEGYEAHLGAAAWYMDSERAVYEDLADGLRYAALGRLAAQFGDELDAAVWDAVDAATDWDDNNARIDDLMDEIADAYAEAVEDDDEDEEI